MRSKIVLSAIGIDFFRTSNRNKFNYLVYMLIPYKIICSSKKHAVVTAVLISFSLAGCLSASPSNSVVLDALTKQDFLVKNGCAEYSNFERINGIDKGSQYIVKYHITQKQILSSEACTKKITDTASNDPVAGLGVISGLWDSMGPLVELSVNGGVRSVQGELAFIKSEKGWIVNE